jgi:IS5 family transposase
MRQERAVQASLFDLFANHEIGRELKAMSQWLDEHRELIGLAAEDLRRHGVQETGREGLPAESVLRCALLKQHRQLSYEELAFHLEDSASFRAFARLPLSWTPKKSVLHRTISAIRAESWEAINRTLLVSARQEKVETGKVRSACWCGYWRRPTRWPAVFRGATIGARRRNGLTRSNIPATD